MRGWGEIMQLDIGILKRYLGLIRYLHFHGGYGTFLVVMHGRRPVSVVRVPTPKRLDVEDEEPEMEEV